MTKNSLITIDDHSITKTDFYQSIENEIIHLHETGDVNHVMKFLNALDEVEGVTGHAKARLLWASSEWFKGNKPDEDFYDHVESTTSTRAITAKRYVMVQAYIEDYSIPKDVAERPMRDLVPIASTLKQGYAIDGRGWEKIRLSATDGELRDVLRKIKGKEERKSAKILRLERDGTINLYIKGKEKKFIGYLNIKDTDEDIVNAVEKIKVSSSMVEG